jgi:methyl-accepting chemotaxis protein
LPNFDLPSKRRAKRERSQLIKNCKIFCVNIFFISCFLRNFCRFVAFAARFVQSVLAKQVPHAKNGGERVDSERRGSLKAKKNGEIKRIAFFAKPKKRFRMTGRGVAKFYKPEKFRHSREFNRMSINTKLVLLLTLAVGAVMLIGSILSLRQRETALETALGDELRAHAVTLQIALEENYEDGRINEAQKLIDRLRGNSRVYGVLLFDENGALRSASQVETATDFRQPPELARVLQTGEPVEFVRTIENRKFLSIILPLRLTENKLGAIEIVKPLALIEDDIARARLNRLATTLLLLATIFLVVYVVLRRSLSRPITALLVGARTLGEGNLAHRVAVGKNADELAQLATEFNRMADNLAEQKRRAELEAENRLNLEKELRHSERLASVGRLAAGIAHELGAPLNVIDARAEQLIERASARAKKQIKNLNDYPHPISAHHAHRPAAFKFGAVRITGGSTG